MSFKKLVFLVASLVVLTTARRLPKPIFVPVPSPCPPIEITVIADGQPCCSPPPCCCNDELAPICTDLILPPISAELPCGLGYLPAAAPLVAAAYGPKYSVSNAACSCSPCIPVTSFGGVTLATPVSPCLASLVRPIIL